MNKAASSLRASVFGFISVAYMPLWTNAGLSGNCTLHDIGNCQSVALPFYIPTSHVSDLVCLHPAFAVDTVFYFSHADRCVVYLLGR